MHEIATLQDFHRLATAQPRKWMSLTRGDQGFSVWRRYFVTKGFEPWAFARARLDETKSWTAPCEFPEWFETGWADRPVDLPQPRILAPPSEFEKARVRRVVEDLKKSLGRFVALTRSGPSDWAAAMVQAGLINDPLGRFGATADTAESRLAA